MKKLTALPKFFFGSIFLLGFFLLSLSFPSPSDAVLLQDENQCILGGNCGGTGGTPGSGFDDKAFNLNQMAGTVDSLNYLLSGQSEAHPELAALGNRGAVGTVGNLIGVLYAPPVSSLQYLAYLKQNLGLTTPVYAQTLGTGFSGLSYLLPVWRVFRDAAYLVYILLFVIAGLLIMFRIKISPQAVISLQSALPGLLFSLILITLSFAIVGLMIDLMYVFIYFVLGLLGGVSGVDIAGLDQFQNKNVFEYWQKGASLGFNSITTPAAGISEIIGSMTNNIFVLTGLLQVGAQGIATAVITIAILFALFRLFFALLKSYVWVLVLVIFAPFILLAGAMPGKNGLSPWIKGLLANLVVFPTTVVMFTLASIFIQLSGTVAPGAGWVAPLIGGNSIAAIQALIGLGMILLTPQVTQMMNDAFKPPPFPYGVAIGQSIGAGAAYPSRVGRGVGGTLMSANEAVLTPGGGSERRGFGRAITGGLLGKR